MSLQSIEDDPRGDSPELNLWRHVFLCGLRDAMKTIGGEAAREWVHDRTEYGTGSFNWICDLLQLNSEVMRTKMREMIEQREPEDILRFARRTRLFADAVTSETVATVEDLPSVYTKLPAHRVPLQRRGSLRERYSVVDISVVRRRKRREQRLLSEQPLPLFDLISKEGGAQI